MINKILVSIKHATIGILVLAIAFMAIEPAVSFGANALSQFTISQTVTTQIAFATPASNVVMSPTLGGLTGGTSTGATVVAVTSNDALGYNMTIQASTSLGMQGTASTTNYIPAYTSAVNGVPDYTFTAPANTARFGYNVTAASTTDVATLFKNNGSVCNTGTLTSTSNCWLAATTSAVTIINRNLPTPYTGATTTISFQLAIEPNPSPVIPNDTYVATTTLTATAN